MQKAFLSVVLCLSLCFSLPVSAHAAKSKASSDSLRLSYEALRDTLSYDISSHGTEEHTDWISLLALLAVKYDGDLECYRGRDLSAFRSKLAQGTSPHKASGDPSLFALYHSTLETILGGMVGTYTQVSADRNGVLTQASYYGLRPCSPLADLHSYTHTDDFGASRIGLLHPIHRGHDLFGSVGTPVIAVEGGVVEQVGWDPDVGWCITIRSRLGERSYRYGHLQEDPSLHGLSQGCEVLGGEVIGTLGITGGSAVPHLHYEMFLVGTEEIYVDLFALTRLFAHRRVLTRITKDGEHTSCRYVLYP